MSELRTISATALQEHELCARKHWITHNTPKDQRPPPTEAQKEGTDFHTDVETYEKTGALPETKFKPLIEMAIPLLPPPKHPAVHVEGWAEWPTYKGGPLWKAKIDLIDARGEVLAIIDHKTYKTSSKKHTYLTLGPLALAESVQMTAYARYGLTDSRFSGKDRANIRLSHLYYRLDGKPDVQEVAALASAKDVNTRWDAILAKVSQVQAKVETVKDFRDVPPNPEACEAFGGCPYKEKCGMNSEIARGLALYQIGGAGMAKTGLLDRIKSNAPKAEESASDLLPPDAPPREASAEEKQTMAEGAPANRPEPEPEAPQEEKQENKPKAKGLPVPKLEIYVDCYPVVGEEKPVPFESFVLPLAAGLADEAGLSDIRFMSYGAHKPKLKSAIQDALGVCPRVILVSSMATYSDIFLEAAYPYAVKIVKGLRG